MTLRQINGSKEKKIPLIILLNKVLYSWNKFPSIIIKENLAHKCLGIYMHIEKDPSYSELYFRVSLNIG